MVDNPTALCYNYYISKETNKQIRKRYKMKDIVSILAVVAATATSVSAAPGDVIGTTTIADHPKWNGSIEVNAIPDHCEFVNNTTDGDMTYNIGSGVWTTTSDASVMINHRGASKLAVTNTGFLQRVDVADPDMAVVVDYTGSSISGDGAISLSTDLDAISVGSLTDSSGIKSTTINIGGSAQMVDTNVETNGIENNGQYIIVHTVNCIQ